MTTRTTITKPHSETHPHGVVIIDDSDADDSYAIDVEAQSAIDPLAAEPLTTDEIRALEEHDPDIDEGRENTYRAIADETEATMPFDADGGATGVAASDATLSVWTRPKRKAGRG